MLLLPNTWTLFYLTSLIILTQTLSIQQAGQNAPLFQFAVSWFYAFQFSFMQLTLGVYALYI